MRSGAVWSARQSHKLKVGGSNPPSATNTSHWEVIVSGLTPRLENEWSSEMGLEIDTTRFPPFHVSSACIPSHF